MCSLCQLPVAKNHNFVQILIFWGLLYRPLLPMRAKFGELQQTEGLRLPAKFRLDRFTLSSCGGEKNNFCRFWTSAFSDVANWRQSQKVEYGCIFNKYITTNLPLSSGVKIVSVLQRLHGEIGFPTLTFKSVTDK